MNLEFAKLQITSSLRRKLNYFPCTFAITETVSSISCAYRDDDDDAYSH